MFSDPQFWVAVAFVAFIAAIFNPVRKILTSNLDAQIKDIRNKIDEAENLKNETQTTLSEIKKRQNDVQIEIQDIHKDAEKKVKQLEENAEAKLKDSIDGFYVRTEYGEQPADDSWQLTGDVEILKEENQND